MPEHLHTLELPLLLTGIPAVVRHWLREAGVPVAPFRLGMALRPAVEASGRIVLYDSRSVASRCDAEAARFRGLRALDVAPLVERPPGSRFGLSRLLSGRTRLETDRGRFLLQLKNAIERGGVWARIADYPFPWQSVACGGDGRFLPELSRLAALFPVAPGEPDGGTEGTDLASWIAERCSRGLPFALATTDDAPEFTGNALHDYEEPLLWRTSFAEFANWWRVREGVSVWLRQEGEMYHLACEGDFGGFRPALELWQGEHVALLPLSSGETSIRRSGLVFQYVPGRHPGGFTSQLADHRPEPTAVA